MSGIRKMQQITKTSYTISSIKVIDLFWRNIFLLELRLRMLVVRQGLMRVTFVQTRLILRFIWMFTRPKFLRTRLMRTIIAFFLELAIRFTFLNVFGLSLLLVRTLALQATNSSYSG